MRRKSVVTIVGMRRHVMIKAPEYWQYAEEALSAAAE
jgi:hypothetical protein